MEDINEHELLRKCTILNERHEKVKANIMVRSLENEKAINELNNIESEYKLIIDKLKLIKDSI